MNSAWKRVLGALLVPYPRFAVLAAVEKDYLERKRIEEQKVSP